MEKDENAEIAIVGDLNDAESDVSEKLLAVPAGGECVLYFNSPGGSPYTAMSLVSLMQLRNLNATGVVAGECSSAAVWPFAACRTRFVLPYSVLLFHPMKWQSEDHVDLREAAEWSRHFEDLDKTMVSVLAALLCARPEMLAEWMTPGRYISGVEFAEAGFAELIDPAKGLPNSATGST